MKLLHEEVNTCLNNISFVKTICTLLRTSNRVSKVILWKIYVMIKINWALQANVKTSVLVCYIIYMKIMPMIKKLGQLATLLSKVPFIRRIEYYLEKLFRHEKYCEPRDLLPGANIHLV